MPTKYFARFSRIIALLVLENTEKMDFKELPYYFIENKMIKIHTFLLSVPDFLEKYTLILECLKEIMENLANTTAETLEKKIKVI